MTGVVKISLDCGRRLNAVHRAFQADIHQDELRAEIKHSADGTLTRLHCEAHFIPHLPRRHLQVFGDYSLVFDHEDSGLRGGNSHASSNARPGPIIYSIRLLCRNFCV